jgi:quinol monooxygenase YgiN
MVKVGLYAQLEAAEGRAEEVANFLRSALDAIQQEEGTVAWYALQMGPTTFGVFDAFEDDDGRQAHLNGVVAQGLGDHMDLFAKPPEIMQLDILAAK